MAFRPSLYAAYFDFELASGARRWVGWTTYGSLNECVQKLTLDLLSEYVQKHATQVLVNDHMGRTIFYGSIKEEVLGSPYVGDDIHPKQLPTTINPRSVEIEDASYSCTPRR